MGKLIMCTRKIAENPYRFKATGVLVYSMEELCYYIFHHVDIITEDLFDLELVAFIRDELGLTQRAEFIEKLMIQKASLKDITVSIFCSADYFNEQEIKSFLNQIDILFKFNTAQRKKRHADYCFQNKQYKEAMREYRYLLNSKESQELSNIEFGDILHNIGVLMVRSGSFVMAADNFREAYERNGREESIKQYLYALKCGNKEELYSREQKLLISDSTLMEEIENQLQIVTLPEEKIPSFNTVEKLKELKELGKLKEYYQIADKLLDTLKQKYRTESLY